MTVYEQQLQELDDLLAKLDQALTRMEEDVEHDINVLNKG